MGEFEAGKWIISLTLYFFLFFLIVFSVIEGSVDDVDDVVFSNPGFAGVSTPENVDSSFSSVNDSGIDYGDTDVSYSTFTSTLAVITGINSAKVKIGMPATFRWIFSFILFWIPFIIFVWSIYMALPIIH